jgi:hypothetical protein
VENFLGNERTLNNGSDVLSPVRGGAIERTLIVVVESACGGGFKYLHCRRAIPKSSRRGKQCLGTQFITGSRCLPGWGIPDSETANVAIGPAGLVLGEGVDRADEVQQQF